MARRTLARVSIFRKLLLKKTAEPQSRRAAATQLRAETQAQSARLAERLHRAQISAWPLRSPDMGRTGRKAMASGKPFPLNAWYPAAWGHEIGRALAARTICGHDIVLYRRADGAVAALEDACWHRLLPLSMGRLVGDQVVCGYHGLVFNSAGRCTHMPAQKTINPSAAVRSLSGRRAPSADLGLAGRSGPRRSRRHAGFPLERRAGVDGRGRDFLLAQVRLPAGGRQSDGPHPRDLRPCRQHRRRRDPRYAVRGDPHRSHRDA